VSIESRDQAGTPQQAISTDYFAVGGKRGFWYVSTEMARFIESCLDARKPRAWVKFVDLSGARVRLRSGQIQYLTQCTAEQRAFKRQLFKALDDEEEADEKGWK
jgi:hypothetical protein